MSRPRVTRGWPLEAFVGDRVVCILEGEHLDQVDSITVEPMGKGILITIGDPHGQLPDPPPQSDQALTVTFEIQPTTYPGEKRILLHSQAGCSDPLPFLIMM
ncbi:MAG: hypothetical protein HC924_03825 [Synechococcaceae cyanobacterium SM2_3_2]|nr:hypothetical protein [Synechococcaceae cyanobacterium SM2_3_2]